MKFLSDLDTNGNGKFMVEWEYAEGGRYWETFDTEEAREEALRKNEEWNNTHQAEVDAYELQDNINYMELLNEVGDCCMLPYDEFRLNQYNQMKAAGHHFTLKSFQDMYDLFLTSIKE